jgi:hypothetical protein
VKQDNFNPFLSTGSLSVILGRKDTTHLVALVSRTSGGSSSVRIVCSDSVTLLSGLTLTRQSICSPPLQRYW